MTAKSSAAYAQNNRNLTAILRQLIRSERVNVEGLPKPVLAFLDLAEIGPTLGRRRSSAHVVVVSEKRFEILRQFQDPDVKSISWTSDEEDDLVYLVNKRVLSIIPDRADGWHAVITPSGLDVLSV